MNGPLQNTVLDPCPDVRFHILTVVATIDCEDSKWVSELRLGEDSQNTTLGYGY
jgi:hypothetical protein